MAATASALAEEVLQEGAMAEAVQMVAGSEQAMAVGVRMGTG